MAVFYDQLNREVNLPSVPKGIISVVPSQTELLFYLGLDKEVIGITKFCIHPGNKFKTTTKVGGTKQLNIKLIKELKPDLIIANKEENEQSQIEELMTICPIWISDISNLDEALDMITKVGELVNRQKEAQILTAKVSRLFSQLAIRPKNLSVAYLIWRKPYMVAGKYTFIDDMLQKCGLINAFDEGRYPEVTSEMLIDTKPDVVLLSSEPYPFTQKHIDEFKSMLPNSQIILVDGELFSWYGNRLLHAPDYFTELVGRIIRQ
ncbi:helical backbone metal receptor [Mucilaginibacter sp.]|uniref:ABC transporter substrate-binding protein n=1 Tax=Mucilaginibacter sp. TaxID=1882438 RepID=UPI0026127104|nr:helical backbone metal receptor [Mucilaginibacter sp.]MDB5031170.1 transporter substrate-binding protein [Mucilaginibacter sp.]